MILKSVRFHFADGTWRESVCSPPRTIDWEFLGASGAAGAAIGMTVTTYLTPEEFRKYWEEVK
jgi:hypothetical protein